MCNTAHNLKAVFFPLVFLNFGHTFAVTACTHSNMSLNLGFSPPLAYTFVKTEYVVVMHGLWLVLLYVFRVHIYTAKIHQLNTVVK